MSVYLCDGDTDSDPSNNSQITVDPHFYDGNTATDPDLFIRFQFLYKE